VFYNIGERKESKITKPYDNFISVDEGWSKRITEDGYILYKGWTDNGIEDKINRLDFTSEYGFYTIIHKTKDKIYTYRDNHRNVPEIFSPMQFGYDLWLISNEKSIPHPDRQFDQTPCDSTAYWDIKENKSYLKPNNEFKEFCKQLMKKIKFNSMDLNECAEACNELLSKRMKKFFDQYGHRRTLVPLTGGYDSTLVASIAIKNNFPVEIHRGYPEPVMDREPLLIEISNSEKYPKLQTHKVVKYVPNSNLLVGGRDEYALVEPRRMQGHNDDAFYRSLYDQLITMKDSYSYYHIFEHYQTKGLNSNTRELELTKPPEKNKAKAIFNFARMMLMSPANFAWRDQLVCEPQSDFNLSCLLLQLEEKYVPEMIMNRAVQHKMIEINCPDLLVLLNKYVDDIPAWFDRSVELPNNVKKYFANV
jgi:hypothetical protein